MKRSSLLLLTLSILTSLTNAVTEEALAQSSDVVKCPVIALRRGGEFQALSSREFYCLKSTKAARSRGLISGKLFIGSSFAALNAFTVNGIGESNSPVFRVANRSAKVTYNYTGKGSFKIDVINQRTGARVDRIADSRGPAQGSTFINVTGVFYLRISGDNEKLSENSPNPTWDVTLAN